MTKKLIGELELNRIYQRDCIEGMRMLPDDSVDLIIADPPYYKIKGDFDFKWRTMGEYLDWCAEWLKECERVLSPQGSFYIYGVELQLEHLAVLINNTTALDYKNRITLNKRSYIKDKYDHMEHFRRFIPVAEHLLFYTFQDSTGLSKVMGDYSNFATLKQYFANEKARIESDLGIKLKEHVKWTTHFHWFAQGQSWGMCTAERYAELRDKFPGYFLREYESLRQEYESLRQEYEKQRYTFNAKDGMTNVWEFEPDRGKLKTKHPTQKPLAICERIVSISSNDGDVVLVPFVGSGSECLAAVRTGRNFIGFELESEYIKIANQRLEAVEDEEAERKLNTQ